MVYNERKRNFEKITGIFGVILSALQIIVLIPLLLVVLTAKEIYHGGEHGKVILDVFFNDSIVVSLILASIYGTLFAILMIIFFAQLIKSPVSKEKTQISKRNGIRICTLVFSVINGQLVLIVLTIIMVCMKDFVPEEKQVYLVEKKPVEKVKKEETTVKVTQNKPQENKEMSFEEKIAELKRLKDLGLIDDESYNKAVRKIVSDYI